MVAVASIVLTGTSACVGRGVKDSDGDRDSDTGASPSDSDSGSSGDTDDTGGPSRRWIALSVGGFEACALSDSLRITCWGSPDC